VDAQDSSVEDKVTVKTFKSSGYQEITWPIVESQALEATFAPLAFELVKQGEFAVDALFEVFEPLTRGLLIRLLSLSTNSMRTKCTTSPCLWIIEMRLSSGLGMAEF